MQSNISMKDRALWMDLLRIFSIFAMIAIHVSAAGFNQPVKGFNFGVMNFYNSLSRFCVPVFVMISGALFLNPKRELSLKKLYLHNMLRIVTAFLFWSFAYALYHFIEQGKAVNTENIKGLIKTVLGGEYHLWFLFAIAGLYILTPVLRSIARDKKVAGYFLLCSFIFVVLQPFIYQFFTVPIDIKAIPPKLTLSFLYGYPIYYVGGYYFSQYKPKRLVKWLIYALGAAASIFMIVYTAVKSAQKGSPNDVLYYYFSLTTCLQALAVFIFFKEETPKLRFSEKQARVIVKISALSFGAYLLHVFFLILFGRLGLTCIAFNPIFAVPVRVLCVALASYAVAYLLSLIPGVKKYVI